MRRIWLSVLAVPMFALAVSAQTDGDGTYRVARVIDLGVLAGPRGTAPILAPDGSRYAYFDERNGRSVSLYSLPENELEASYGLDEEVRPDLERVRWSPDGRYLAFTDREGLRASADSDILLLDVEAGEIRNLTEDGYDGGLLMVDESAYPFYVDVDVAWSDDGRLTILRYPVKQPDPATELQIVVAEADSGELEVLAAWTPAIPYLGYSLAWSGDTIAVGRVPPDPRPPFTGIDLVDARTGERTGVVPVSESLNVVLSMQFSADGAYLFGYDPTPRSQYIGALDRAEYDGAGMIRLSDRSELVVSEDLFVIQAGFAPRGRAIAYIARAITDTSGDGPVGNGLYIAPGPGEPGELVLPPALIHCPTPMAQTHLIWASNDTIIVRNQYQAALILLERR